MVTFTQTVVFASIAILAITDAIFISSGTDSIADGDEEFVETDIEAKKQKRNMFMDIYKRSGIEDFAKNHREELAEAKNSRKIECRSIVSAPKLDCSTCALIFGALRDLEESGFSQDDIAELATTACVEFQMGDSRVCHGMNQEFKPVIFGVLSRLTYSPEDICRNGLVPNCGEPFDPVAMWNITFPSVRKPPIDPPSLPKPGSPTLRVLHLTDFHMDPEYTPDTNAECDEPLCCRKDDGSPAPGVPGAGKYGDYRNCDVAPVTVDSLFQHLNSIQDQFDYVIFTGDISPHNVWIQSREEQTTALDRFTEYAKKYLPNKTFFNTLGNHESFPLNNFPPPYITGNESADWLYTAVARNWLNWLPPETESTIKKAGFYSTKPFPGLRVISLNMNMCHNLNLWLYINVTDPAGMLQWFISELQDAADAGDKVHVIGHIYPGCACCLKPWSWNYYKIVNRYESTIVEQFFGHSHAMIYEMFYDEETMRRPLGVAYMAGSITTYSHLNPGFRIYEIDGNYGGSTWRVQDYTNYYLNLTHANMYGEAVWQKEYSAKEEYGMTSLFPDDWNKLIYRMTTDDNLFQKFCKHMSKSAPNTCRTCTGECKKKLLCRLKTGRNGDPDICKDLPLK